MTCRAPRPQEGLHRDRPEDDDHTKVPQQHHLAFQIRLASDELNPRRPVLWRGTPHRGGDVAISKGESIVFRNGSRLIRKTSTVQRPIQEFPAPVSRECAAGAIASMGRRR